MNSQSRHRDIVLGPPFYAEICSPADSGPDLPPSQSKPWLGAAAWRGRQDFVEKKKIFFLISKKFLKTFFSQRVHFFSNIFGSEPFLVIKSSKILENGGSWIKGTLNYLFIVIRDSHFKNKNNRLHPLISNFLIYKLKP